MTSTRPSDFPDWLPPMLVKELRQGLRGNLFVILLIALQVALTCLVISATYDDSSVVGGRLLSTLIYVTFGFAALVVQPLRAIHSLASDVQGGTLETLSMAGLKAGKMVFGKWIALCSQTVLLFITLLPYQILRYFFGGMNPVSELVVLVVILTISLGMTACAVAFSGYTSTIVRYTLGGMLLAVAGFVLDWIDRIMRYPALLEHLFGLANDRSVILAAGLMVYILYIVHFMLSLGASLIAPPAENHAVGRRLVSVVMLLALVPLTRAHLLGKDVFILLILLAAFPALVSALTESPSATAVPSRFDRFGAVGRAAGWFLRPTRSSGELFAVLFFGLFCLVLVDGSKSFSGGRYVLRPGQLIGILSVAGALLVPASWQALFFRGDGQRMGNYLLVMAASTAMWAALKFMPNDGAMNVVFAVFSWHPLSFLGMDYHDKKDFIHLGAVILFHLLLILGCTLRRMKHEQTASSPLPPETNLPATA